MPPAAENPYLPYRATLLSPQRVKELSKLTPVRPIRDTVFCWLAILVAWSACALWPRWEVVLLSIPIIGNRYYALFIIGHDAFHRRIFTDKTHNDLFSDLFLLGPIGGITRFTKHNHLSHHSHLATGEDPDRHKHTCSSKPTSWQLLLYLTGLKSVIYTVANVFLGAKNVAPEENEVGSEPNRRSYRPFEFAILVGWQVVLISGLSLSIGWWAYPLLWITPVYVFAYLADNLRSFAEHSQPYRDQIADQRRLVTFVPGPIESLLIAPMNMNFHAAHHLWPSIPYYNLPLADAEMRSNQAPSGIEWRNSYLGYLAHYFRKLPLKECIEK